MYNLYFLSGFNNYYNRQIKLPKSRNISDFMNYVIKISETETFNPGDGVITQMDVNYWEEPYILSDDADMDYLLISTDGTTIDSKWFIISRNRIRQQQWRMTLRRDLVADNFESVKSAPCFIEKATLSSSSPFLYNMEDFSVNQIKQQEYLLKDKTDCPWLVGYLARNRENDIPFSFKAGTEIIADETVDNLENYILYRYTSRGNVKVVKDINETGIAIFCDRNYDEGEDLISFYGGSYFGGYGKKTLHPDTITNAYDWWIEGASNTSLYIEQPIDENAAARYLYEGFIQRGTYNWVKDRAVAYIDGYTKLADPTILTSRQDKIVYETQTDKYYRVSISERIDSKKVMLPASGILTELIYDAIPTGEQLYWDANAYPRYFKIDGSVSDSCYGIFINCVRYEVELIEINPVARYASVIGSDRTILQDAPYDMICMPFSDTIEIEINDNVTIRSNKAINLEAMMNIAQLGQSMVYDVQLLPYCPIQERITAEGKIYAKEEEQRDIINLTGGSVAVPIGAIIYCNKSKFEFDISHQIPIPDSALERKIMNQCDLYRLCSPNYNGGFDFNPVKNNGVQYFNVDCTYKPYQPYIHINPNFGGLYGSDFNDARGLICAGDFSLPATTDQWKQYEINNKNYQVMFNREMENLETTRRIQRTQEIASLVTTGLATTVGGAASGMMIGGPVGAGIGGTIGAAAGIAGGIADYKASEALFSESLDYKRDMYNYNLQNIKALPNSLTKVSAYNNNNKIFPLIEYYSCTPEEKEAFRNKLHYNGMSIGAIGRIGNYIQATPTYIKGSIIRIENNEQLDFHSLSELSNEIYKGVFI